LGFEKGEVRFHIPVLTNPDVRFSFLTLTELKLNAGECLVPRLSLPHWIENRGSSDRIHLVIDCEVNEWLREFFAAAELRNPNHTIATTGDADYSPDELQRFRLAVLDDLNLQQQLRVTAEIESLRKTGSGYW